MSSQADLGRLLNLGEPAPWFHAETLDGPSRYAFDTVAGRWTVMLLIGSGAHEEAQAALHDLRSNRDLFDDRRACFFGVTVDPSDATQLRVSKELPGVRWFLDYDCAVSKLYGAVKGGSSALLYAPHWLLLDSMLRVHLKMPLAQGKKIFSQLRKVLVEEPPISTAPVLVVPNILPPDLCTRLIAHYEADGGRESGFMRDEDGITVERSDHRYKRRADCNILDEHILSAIKPRLFHVLNPLIRRAFQFDATRIERFIVSCYDAAAGGHFGPHRDNTTKGTAHRKFACTINLNAESYEGGDLSFPEFGARTYRAPTGGAIVFSCSLLHEVRPVTKGRRYAFLPFLYDDDGARLRERNLAYVAAELQSYRA